LKILLVNRRFVATKTARDTSTLIVVLFDKFWGEFLSGVDQTKEHSFYKGF